MIYQQQTATEDAPVTKDAVLPAGSSSSFCSAAADVVVPAAGAEIMTAAASFGSF